MGIFDDAFQTQGPDTGAALALMEQALSARKQALDPTNILQSLEKGAKVFTDMEDRQRKANTANLKRKLASIPPAVMQELLSQGIDPIEFVQNSWAPIDVADEGLNTTWGNQIQAAKNDATARTVYNELNRTPEQVEQDMLNGVTVADRAGLYTDLGNKELHSVVAGQNQNVRDIQTAEAVRRLNAATPKEREAYLTEKGVLTGLGKFANSADPTLNRIFGGFNDKVTAYNTALATLNVDNVSAEDIRKGWLEGKDPILDMLEEQEYFDPSNATLQKAIQERKKWVSDNLTEDAKRKIAVMSDDELLEFFRGNKSFENQDRMTGSSLNTTASSEKNTMDKANAIAAQINANAQKPSYLIDTNQTADQAAAGFLDRGSRHYYNVGEKDSDRLAQTEAARRVKTEQELLTSSEKVAREGKTSLDDNIHYKDRSEVTTEFSEAQKKVAQDFVNTLRKDEMLGEPKTKIQELARDLQNPNAKKEINRNVEQIIAEMDEQGKTEGLTRAQVAKLVYDELNIPNEARESSTYWDEDDNGVQRELRQRTQLTDKVAKSSKEFFIEYKRLKTTADPAQAAQYKANYINANVDKILQKTLNNDTYAKLTGSELSEASVKTARLEGLNRLRKAYKNDIFNEDYLLKKEIFEAGLAKYAEQADDITKAYLEQVDRDRIHAKDAVAKSNTIRMKDENKGVIKEDTPNFITEGIYQFIPKNGVGNEIHNMLNVTDPKMHSLLLSEIVSRMEIASEVKHLKTQEEATSFFNTLKKDQFNNLWQSNLVSDLKKIYEAYKSDDEATKNLRDRWRANQENKLYSNKR